MISLDKSVIARCEKGGLCFEILVEPENAWKMKKGEKIEVENLIAARDVFSDARKGERASDADINKAFGTNNFETVVEKIIKQGELQLTTEQKKRMQEERRKQVINLIARSAVDPRTHAPHPITRIEKALEEAKIHIDAFKSAEEQMEEALKGIKKIIPIKMESVRIAVKIPPEHAPKVYGFIHSHKTTKEEWGSDGSFLGIVEIPAGMQGEFYDKLNKMTSGNNAIKVIERI